MPVAEITVQYVNFAKPGKKFGSVKSSEGNYYWGPDKLLHAFQQGEVCKIEYSENNGFNSIGKKLGSTKAPPLTPPPRQRTNPVDAENMFIIALLKEFVAAGKVDLSTTEIAQAVKMIREAYRVTLGGLEKQRSDEMDDAVEY